MDDTKKVCAKADFREYQPFRGEPEVICWTCGVPKDKHGVSVDEFVGTTLSGLTAWLPDTLVTPPTAISSNPSGANTIKMAFYHFMDRLNLERSSGKNPHTAYVDRVFLNDLAAFIIAQSPFPHYSVDHLNNTVCIDKINVLPNSGLPYGTILFY